MKKRDLISKVASERSVPAAQIADELDQAVAEILRNLKKGQAVSLPGIGILQRRSSGITLRRPKGDMR